MDESATCYCGWTGRLSECRERYSVYDFIPEMGACSRFSWDYLCPKCGAVVKESEQRVKA